MRLTHCFRQPEIVILNLAPSSVSDRLFSPASNCYLVLWVAEAACTLGVRAATKSRVSGVSRRDCRPYRAVPTSFCLKNTLSPRSDSAKYFSVGASRRKGFFAQQYKIVAILTPSSGRFSSRIRRIMRDKFTVERRARMSALLVAMNVALPDDWGVLGNGRGKPPPSKVFHPFRLQISSNT